MCYYPKFVLRTIHSVLVCPQALLHAEEPVLPPLRPAGPPSGWAGQRAGVEHIGILSGHMTWSHDQCALNCYCKYVWVNQLLPITRMENVCNSLRFCPPCRIQGSSGINPCQAELTFGNIKIYLQVQSYLKIDMVQVVEIFLLERIHLSSMVSTCIMVADALVTQGSRASAAMIFT